MKRPVSDQSRNESTKKMQRFRQAYCKTWPCINQSSKGDNFAFCKLYLQTFQLAYCMMCILQVGKKTKPLIFNGSCSTFEHFSLKIGHIFLPSLKPLSSKIKISSICLSLNIVGSDKHRETC